MKQQRLFRGSTTSFGGNLLTKRKGRTARPLDTKNTMHLVLRSTQAVGPKSFRRHRTLIDSLLKKFAHGCGVQVVNFANVGNHLHIHLRLTTRQTWCRFIRAITAAIAVKIGGKNRWAKKSTRFWDRRPFTRVVIGPKSFATLTRYVRLNQLESEGIDRDDARIRKLTG